VPFAYNILYMQLSAYPRARGTFIQEPSLSSISRSRPRNRRIPLLLLRHGGSERVSRLLVFSAETSIDCANALEVLYDISLLDGNADKNFSLNILADERVAQPFELGERPRGATNQCVRQR